MLPEAKITCALYGKIAVKQGPPGSERSITIVATTKFVYFIFQTNVLTGSIRLLLSLQGVRVALGSILGLGGPGRN